MSTAPGGDLLTPLWTAGAAPALGGRQWEDLLSQARRAKMLARLGLLMAGRGWTAGAPPGVRVQFDNALKQIRRLHDQTQWELDRIAHALAALPGPVVLLKGAAYVAAGLPPAPGRLFNDVDLMVPREQIRAAEQALFAAGWVAARLDPYDERYYRDLMHEIPPLEHVERRTTLDLHHAITPPTSRFAVTSTRLTGAIRSRKCSGIGSAAAKAQRWTSRLRNAECGMRNLGSEFASSPRGLTRSSARRTW